MRFFGRLMPRSKAASWRELAGREKNLCASA